MEMGNESIITQRENWLSNNICMYVYKFI